MRRLPRRNRPLIAATALTVAVLGPPNPVTGADPGVDWFTSPTGNIACDISHRAGETPYVRCDLKDRTFSPPPAPPIHTEYCSQGPWAKSVQLHRNEPAHFYCISDTVFKDGLPVLAYGEQTTVADFRCTSAADGITCTDLTTGNGFRLARDSYEFF